MRLHKLSLIVGLALVLMGASACSFTTANISSLKFSKDKEGKTEATTFAPGDTIYAIATVSNVPSKVTLKFRLLTEDVEGQPKNAPIPNFETSIELPSSGFGTFTLTPPPAGWPAGKYKVEIAMLIESGEQKDQEAASFTVAGERARTTPAAGAPDASQTPGGANDAGGAFNLTGFKLTTNAKSDTNAPSESTFSPNDHVYVVYSVENMPAGGKITCTLYAENAEGAESGETLRLLSYTNPTSAKFTENFDLDPSKSSKTGEGAWGSGTYRVVLETQASPNAPAKELKSATFTVSGE
jgi:hypothetical protein